MNMEHLNIVFQNYMSKFDEMNDEKHNETYKWVALEHFRKNWDMEAPNFAAMFKEAVSMTDNLIDNSKVHPTTGIVRLAKEDPNAARGLFRDLYKKDKGDLIERQGRIDRFVTEANALMEKHGKGTWKYNQDRKTVIFYLNLRYPDENFMFKSTEAKKFADVIEYDDSWGSGQYFKLHKYYKMCENLVNVIEDHPELLSVHQRRNLQKYEDRKYHVLAYDIIYCAHHYGLYENIVIRPRKGKTVKNTVVEISEEVRMELQMEHQAIQTKLTALDEEKSRLEEGSVRGADVTHKVFGPGVVTDQEGRYIMVKFGDAVKRFAIPDAFADGYLVSEDKNVMERCSLELEVIRKSSEQQVQLKDVETQLK